MKQHRLLLVSLTFCLSMGTAAQVTTSGVRGIIKSAEGDPLPGAQIRLLHETSGTIYFAQSNQSGQYSLININPGEAYTLEVTYTNYQAVIKKMITLPLGEIIWEEVQLTTCYFLFKRGHCCCPYFSKFPKRR